MRHFTWLCACLVLAAAAAPGALPAQTPTFAPPKQISAAGPSASNAFLLASGDFNGNGNTGLVVRINDPGYTFKLLAGDGAGKFTVASTLNIDSNAVVLVGDMNGDGKDDLVIIDPGCPEDVCSKSSILRILLSDGDGHFTTGYTAYMPSDFMNAAGFIGDFNNDGRLDIAVVNYSCCEPIPVPNLVVFINQGDGSFTQTAYDLPANLEGGGFITAPVRGDFEGNGNQELAFVADANSGDLALSELLTFAIDDKGHLGPAKLKYTFNSFLFQFTMYAADLNGDGRTDLVPGLNPRFVGGADVGGFRFPTLLALPSGSFKWSSVRYGPLGTGNYVLADINGDGKPDLIFAAVGGDDSNQPPAFGFIYLGLGNGEFKTPHIPFTVTEVEIDSLPFVAAVPLKTEDLPSLILSNGQSTLELLVNTTKK